MIEKREFYVVVCDICGCGFYEGNECKITVYNTPDEAKTRAGYYNWEIDNNGDVFCAVCWEEKR